MWKYEPQYVKSEYDSNYKWLVTNPEANPSDWNIVDLFAYVAQQQGYVSRKEAVKALGEAAFLNLVERCALDHAESVFRTTAIDNSAGQEIVQARERSGRNGTGFSPWNGTAITACSFSMGRRWRSIPARSGRSTANGSVHAADQYLDGYAV